MYLNLYFDIFNIEQIKIKIGIININNYIPQFVFRYF